MSCERCSAEMNRLFEVVERETLFVHWECACGHRVLEKRPGVTDTSTHCE